MLKQDFVETKLATKFTEFNIRVYRDQLSKETLVLSTQNLDLSQPVLVRVHSECLTGDMFGSLHCDCGNQLTKSLEIISEEGGVLIYLRQEGRGIGLFEKMKSYQLQLKGYDTFEANILLGHQPDLRSYEMVKVILDDLNIKRIKLLTNNPSKVSEIAKLGIEIVERVPLVSKFTKYNKKYLETKKKKFQHFLSTLDQYYFYQFHVDNIQQLEPIIEFLRNKKTDPLLKICTGIRADKSYFADRNEIERVNAIINTCRIHSDLIPIIHFSFHDCRDILVTTKQIKETWPLINRIQLNDVSKFKFKDLQQIFALFQQVDIPLCDENFKIINSARYRDLLKRNNSLVLLDNSKGRGIKESREAFKQKIDNLLSHGLNNIGLCGGFGPDELEAYFDIRRYYRINFSIDAETNLRTSDVYDVEKIKTYLLQLIRFDDPKQAGIEQTKKFLERHRRSEWDKVSIENKQFIIHPKVFHAGHFPSSLWFATELSKLLNGESNFCEIGCGSGVISCLVALANPSLQITATDINPFASENTQLNAEHFGIGSRIAVLTGDVLDSIIPQKQFDSIFWALPFGFLDPGTVISLEEAQVFDPGYRAIRKFFQTAKNCLKPDGRLLIGFSSDLGHSTLLEDLAKQASFSLKKIKEKAMMEESHVTFEILEGKIIY
jgi:GTP cyclohydrolase II